MPSSLITFLENNPNCLWADCFVIELPTGQTLCATTGQWDITFRGGGLTPGWPLAQTTFKAAQYGTWSRGKITSEAGTKVNANTMDLMCAPQTGTLYPGLAITIHNAALNHLFDAAQVWVYTVYMPIGGYGDVSAGVETKFVGTITKSPGLGRLQLKFECADPLFLCNMKVPSRLMQANCGWSFCDTNCTLDPANYTVTVTAASGTNRTLTPVTALTQPDGYFAQGVATCLTGANAGLSATVKSYTSGVLTFVVPWILPVAPGDTFAVIKGCDKTAAMCATTNHANGTPEPLNFQLRFPSTPFVPAPSNAL